MSAEVTMIVIDNSQYVPENSYVFKAQLEAIRLYCHAKVKSNPNIRVGAATMGYGAFEWPNPPIEDIEHFLTHTLEHISWGGELSIPAALQYSQLGFARLPEGMRRRMLVFVGGPGYLMDSILMIGKRLKEKNIALDVVSFADEDQEFDAYKTKSLKSFVDVANKDNNSHFARVPSHSSVREILVSSNILSPSEVEAIPLMEEEIKNSEVEVVTLMKEDINNSEVEAIPLMEEEIKNAKVEVVPLMEEEIKNSEVEAIPLMEEEINNSEVEVAPLMKKEIKNSEVKAIPLMEEKIKNSEVEAVPLMEEEIKKMNISINKNIDKKKRKKNRGKKNHRQQKDSKGLTTMNVLTRRKNMVLFVSMLLLNCFIFLLVNKGVFCI